MCIDQKYYIYEKRKNGRQFSDNCAPREMGPCENYMSCADCFVVFWIAAKLINISRCSFPIFNYEWTLRRKSPSHFWSGSQVSVPVPCNRRLLNMAAVWTLVPAPTLRSAKSSCVVASFPVAARDESILGRARCHSRCWNLLCQNKESTMGCFLCGWDEDLRTRSKAIMADWCHCDILQGKTETPL